MVIGIVLSQTPGYSETFFHSKIKGLQNSGVEVRLFSQGKSDGFNLCSVTLSPKVTANSFQQLAYFIKEFFLLMPHLPVLIRYIKLERREGTSLPKIFKKMYLNAHLLKAKVDWLHFGFATLALSSETVAKAIGAKMAVSFRGFDINVYPIKHPHCYKTLWKHVDKVHSISQYLLDKAISNGLSKHTPSAIITPAVQLDTLPTNNFAISSDKISIVTIARITWIKGLDVAIAAMAILKAKGLKFTYYIIGDGDKNSFERYKFMVYELGLMEEIVFCGKLTHQETLQHLSSANIYVQSSLNEGFCNAVLEAQAIGVLTIASNVGGLSENVVDGKTGWLFENFSSESLAQRIQMVVSLSDAQKNTISQNARKRVKEEFNIEKQQKEWLEFYATPIS
ncbi:glycosyltransferase family 4 protein [Aequorivita sp. SDUM287046]|uniref:Glycosyltransferase family 4 protein n=1 Tax=Aequorivita aurantiaca TaxID=3053356 RepID=A0ABT8DIS9_9FLAO|nr:glycosyltransferase family 4 protein [Aequorivita aurantiaca]MDN3725295.1 glycosyltransferase family 4 protein [Aequorivita aurantiaca]